MKRTYAPDPVEVIEFNLLQLSEHFGVDRSTIRATVARHVDFPRMKVGGTKNGWSFNLIDVEKWLEMNTWYRGTRDPSIRALRRAINGGKEGDEIPLSAAKIRDDLLQRDTKNSIQTKLLQLELDKKNGVLVNREEIVGRMSIIVSRLAKQLEMVPNLIGKRTGATDEQIKLWRDHLDMVRNAFVNDSKTVFATDEVGV